MAAAGEEPQGQPPRVGVPVAVGSGSMECTPEPAQLGGRLPGSSSQPRPRPTGARLGLPQLHCPLVPWHHPAWEAALRGAAHAQSCGATWRRAREGRAGRPQPGPCSEGPQPGCQSPEEARTLRHRQMGHQQVPPAPQLPLPSCLPGLAQVALRALAVSLSLSLVVAGEASKPGSWFPATETMTEITVNHRSPHSTRRHRPCTFKLQAVLSPEGTTVLIQGGFSQIFFWG